MGNQKNRSSDRLLTMARLGQCVVACSGVAVVAYCGYLVAVPAEALFLIQKEVPGIQTLPSSSVVVVSACVAAIPILAFLIALLQTWRFFDQVKRGQIYSLEVQHSLKWLGRAAIACTLTGVFARTIVGLLMTSANPPGQKMLIFGISSGEIASAVVGILVFVFANVVREAAALAHENASFV